VAITTHARSTSRFTQIRDALTPGEWRRIAGMVTVIVALHIVGFGLLIVVVAPQHLSLGSQTFGIGLGITAYTLGMRHAFDVDHIAAIDNTTRKLMEEKSRPVSVGFWFSLGHSTIVFAMCVALALGIRTLASQVSDDNSTLHDVTGIVGVSVSGTFLLALGLINLFILVGIVKIFRSMRTEHYDEQTLEDLLQNRGFMNRILRRVMVAVRQPWHMYPVGVLFGFGFDTATEISLLVLASTSAAFVLPWYAILCLPILFMAGMCLFDTMDGSFMNFAYGWAFSKPVRKVYYNITITSLSVIVAVLIGGIELLGLLAEQLGLSGGVWNVIGTVADFRYTGYLVVGVFVATWAISLLIWRYGRIEEKWMPPDASAPE
jgi:nickel/cobalt transporter (NiCoT) family protein